MSKDFNIGDAVILIHPNEGFDTVYYEEYEKKGIGYIKFFDTESPFPIAVLWDGNVGGGEYPYKEYELEYAFPQMKIWMI